MSGLTPAARRTIAMTAIAKALVDAANDFGEGNQIAGDLWQLADAAVRAVEPMLDKRQLEVNERGMPTGNYVGGEPM